MDRFATATEVLEVRRVSDSRPPPKAAVLAVTQATIFAIAHNGIHRRLVRLIVPTWTPWTHRSLLHHHHHLLEMVVDLLLF